jgi:hypothetical protein
MFRDVFPLIAAATTDSTTYTMHRWLLDHCRDAARIFWTSFLTSPLETNHMCTCLQNIKRQAQVSPAESSAIHLLYLLKEMRAHSDRCRASVLLT